MNLHTRCSACNTSFRATCREERDDPNRLCLRCWIDANQPSIGLSPNPTPEARNGFPRASFPAATAAGLSNPKE